ncbi:hypothetical protein LEP1GSC178_2399 [Leptospira licerasiae str. MMD4847]|uniref:Uncharacterized protein n=1 Tax=Leptospira licerasiae str. MMD4847 TaxID=1049971 RepID=A0ABP2RFS6_9LEPT|nr:hypothetical protein LEP1GSC178_2399 [Leptospira licerasiae str. MMD4847]
MEYNCFRKIFKTSPLIYCTILKSRNKSLNFPNSYTVLF